MHVRGCASPHSIHWFVDICISTNQCIEVKLTFRRAINIAPDIEWAKSEMPTLRVLPPTSGRQVIDHRYTIYVYSYTVYRWSPT